jgi:hypothetical protein
LESKQQTAEQRVICYIAGRLSSYAALGAPRQQ